MSHDLEELLRRTATSPVPGGLDLQGIHRTIGHRRVRRLVLGTTMTTALAMTAVLAILPGTTIFPGSVEIHPVAPPAEPGPADASPTPGADDDPGVVILGLHGGADTTPDRAERGSASDDRPRSTDDPSDPIPDASAPPLPTGPGPSPLAAHHWPFDNSLDGWSDNRGLSEMGFYSVGQTVSTQEQDPRRGWRPYAGDRDGGAVRGRRMNGTMGGGLFSPWVEIPVTAERATVTLWYRWTGEGQDSVKVEVVDTESQDSSSITLRRTADTTGWTQVDLEVAVPAQTAPGQYHLTIRLWSSFEEPEEDCTADPDDWKPACDLGFWLDDARLAFHST